MLLQHETFVCYKLKNRTHQNQNFSSENKLSFVVVTISCVRQSIYISFDHDERITYHY